VFDGVGGDIADAAVEFAAAPQVAAPVNPPQSGKHLKQKTRANTLKQLDDTRNTHIWVESHKQVHVITHHLQLVDDKTMLSGNIPENTLTNTLNLAHQNLITILRAKHDMETHLPESMAHAT